MNRSYRVALFCGSFPLLVGVSIFLLWLITHRAWLMLAGTLTLFGGVALFMIGAVALARSCWLAVRNPDVPRRRVWLSTLGCGGLLLSNLVVAGGISAAVIAMETRYTVLISNASRQPLTDVRVFGGGCEISFDPISPGGAARRSFWVQHDGVLEFHAATGAHIQVQTINGYVTNGMGGHTKVTINPDSSISVSDNNL